MNTDADVNTKLINELNAKHQAVTERAWNLRFTAESFLASALQGGLINFYQGSTDEVALRCIGLAESLLTQLEAKERGEVSPDAANVNAGNMVGGANGREP